jgi:ribosome-associated protein
VIAVTDSVHISESEIKFTFVRSPGPGGQNVNRVATKAILNFDVARSPDLTDEQRALVMRRLKTRINKGGVLRVISSRHRTQSANKVAATERFVELMGEALKKRPKRKRTRVPREAVERRLQEKKHRSQLKRERSQRDF